MCGISGTLGPPARQDHLQDRVARMADTLRHRGPDDHGTWVDPAAGLALGHQRLAIRDPSPDGAQPMATASGRWVLAYNGELYNTDELVAGLPRRRWRGSSDTEVLAECLEHWGVPATLERCNGIFAFAAWDREDRELWLARDRLGVKPLAYGWVDGELLFGSELRAIRAAVPAPLPLDRTAVAMLLDRQSVPAPHTIHRDIRSLPAGHLLRVRDHRDRPEPQCWWDPRPVADAARARPLDGHVDEAIDEVEALVGDAVGRQMVSDVPLGAFLSGGVDSSLVVALMQARSTRPVQTFCVGFEDRAHDESDHAQQVASLLGTKHTDVQLTERELLDLVPQLPELWDEPFADPSAVPTHLVARLARRDVTVALSGDGGDELFGGYATYTTVDRLWRVLSAVPAPARRAARAVLAPLPAAAAAGWLPPTVRDTIGGTDPARRLDRLLAVLDAPSGAELHRQLVGRWAGAAPVLGQPDWAHREPLAPASRLWSGDHDLPLFDRCMLADTRGYLPDTILTKVDRASMAVGLEARVPLLDHRVVELAWRVPQAWRVRDGRQKWLLRQVLHRHVPPELVERPKQGFAIPLGTWLRGPLRPWAEDLLAADHLRRQGVFDVDVVRGAWAQHLAGRSREDALWGVLMFQAWHQRWGGR